MKKVYLFSLLIFTIIFSACSSKDDILVHVPSDANFVAKINTKAIIKDLGITNDLSIINDLNSFLSELKLDKDIVKESGLDYEKDIAVFGLSKNFSYGILLTLKDSDKCHECIKKNIGTINEKNGVSLASKNGVLFAFNDDVLFVGELNKKLTEKEILKSISEVINTTDKSIKDNKEALTALEREGDIACYINSIKVWKDFSMFSGGFIYSNPLAGLAKGVIETLYKYQSLIINLKENSVDIKTESVLNKADRFYNIYNQSFTSITDTQFLNYFSSGANMIFACSVKGTELAKLPELKAITNQVGLSRMGLDAKFIEAVQSINGPIAIGLKGDNQTKDAPMSMVIKSSKPKTIVDLVYSLVSAMLPVKAVGSAYVINYDNNYIEFGADKDYFYVKNYNGMLQNSAYMNKTIQDVFKNNKVGLFMTSGAANTYVSSEISSNIGTKFEGSFWWKMKDLDKSTSKITILQPKANNVLQSLLNIMAGIIKEDRHKEATREMDSAIPIDSDFEPLEDIYNE